MKNKKTLLTLIIILTVLILGMLIGLTILYLKTDIFKTNDVLFAKYLFQNNVEEILNIDNIKKQKQFFKDNMYISSGNILIQVQKEGKENKQINLTTNSKYNKERLYSEVTLKNGQEDVTKMSFINDNNVYGIKCDDVYQYYIGIRNENLKDVAKKLGMSEEQIEEIPNYIPFELINNSSEISEEQVKYLKDVYFKVLADSISKEKYSNTEETTINIQGKDFNVKGYKVTLNSNDVKQIVLNILTKAQNDTNTLNILNSVLGSQGKINVTEEIQKIIKNVQDKQIKEEAQAEIIVYQNDGKMLRTQLKVNDEDAWTFDVIKNEKNNQKVILTIFNKMQYIIEKIDDEDATSFIQEFAYNSDSGSLNYKVSMINNFSNIVDNKAKNSSQIQIINGNKSNVKINYDKTIQKTNENIEIQELKNNNTAIINNYPKEQLDIFFNMIGDKLEILLPSIANKINLKLEQTSELNGYLQGIAASIVATLNASGIEPIFQNVGFGALIGFDLQIQQYFELLELATGVFETSAINEIKDYVTSAVLELTAYAYAPNLSDKTPEQMFIDTFPNGSTVTPGTIIATYDETKTTPLIITIERCNS